LATKNPTAQVKIPPRVLPAVETNNSVIFEIEVSDPIQISSASEPPGSSVEESRDEVKSVSSAECSSIIK
jgi:hypothetical protein